MAIWTTEPATRSKLILLVNLATMPNWSGNYADERESVFFDIIPFFCRHVVNGHAKCQRKWNLWTDTTWSTLIILLQLILGNALIFYSARDSCDCHCMSVGRKGAGWYRKHTVRAARFAAFVRPFVRGDSDRCPQILAKIAHVRGVKRLQ